jgi:Mannose-6-phosphate isomerase
MKEIKKIAEGKNFTAADFGKISEVNEYVFDLGNVKIPGKVFGGQDLGTTGSQFSFQYFNPGEETGFYHTHTTHEELYIFLGGKGEIQIDGQNIPVTEGSVVRVAPVAKRTIRNNGQEPMLMLCVQYKVNSFTAEDATDGNISHEPVKW